MIFNILFCANNSTDKMKESGNGNSIILVQADQEIRDNSIWLRINYMV